MHPTPEHFESLKDYADRKTLQAYDDGRLWFLLADYSGSTKLGDIAYAVYTANTSFIKKLVDNRQLGIFRSINDIPCLNHFHVIYFDDAYFLQPITEE